METRKTTKRTRTPLPTFMAESGSVVRFDSINSNTDTFSFVLNEGLELKERPITNPIIHSSSSMLFSDSFEVFHNNLVPVEVENNVFADVMVNPTHEPFLSSRDLFKKSSGSSCAFGLKNGTQIFELSFDLFDFGRFEELAIRSDGKIVYSEVNADNFVFSRISNNDFFGKCKQEENSAFSIYLKQALFDTPCEIFFIADRDIEWYFDSSIDCGQTQNIIFEGSTAREIVANRSMFNDRFTFNSLNNPASLFDTRYGKLRWQSESLSQLVVNEWMQLDIVFNLPIPCSINAELHGSSISRDSLNYFWSSWNLDFGSCNAEHFDLEEELLYKYYTHISSGINGGFAFLPYLKIGVSSEYDL